MSAVDRSGAKLNGKEYEVRWPQRVATRDVSGGSSRS